MKKLQKKKLELLGQKLVFVPPNILKFLESSQNTI